MKKKTNPQNSNFYFKWHIFPYETPEGELSTPRIRMNLSLWLLAKLFLNIKEHFWTPV